MSCGPTLDCPALRLVFSTTCTSGVCVWHLVLMVDGMGEQTSTLLRNALLIFVPVWKNAYIN